MGDSNGAGVGVSGRTVSFRIAEARRGDAASTGKPALALRAAAAMMMRRAAARLRASGAAEPEPDLTICSYGDDSTSASAAFLADALCAPASGDNVRDGFGVEAADDDRGGGGGENTKFVTGSLAEPGDERRFAGLAAAMMRRAAATLSMAGDARRPSSRLWGVDGNGEGGGFRGVNAPGLDALASAEKTVFSSAKLASFSKISARGGDAGGGMGPPPASSAARSAAAAASDSHPFRNAAFGACVACVACVAPSNANVIVVVAVVVSFSRRLDSSRSTRSSSRCGSGVGSKARHEGVATGGS